jgi:hypothetical protein
MSLALAAVTVSTVAPFVLTVVFLPLALSVIEIGPVVFEVSVVCDIPPPLRGTQAHRNPARMCIRMPDA